MQNTLVNFNPELSPENYDQIVKFLKSREIDHKEFIEEESSKKINLQHSITAGLYKGYTLIAIASQYGSLELVKLLITLGADINSALTEGTFRGYTPMALAIYGQKAKIVELFFTLGVDYNYTLDDGHYKGYNSVAIASIKGWSEITKIFSQANAKATDEYDQIVKFLKSRGIDHKEFTAEEPSKKINLQHSITEGPYKGYTLIALASQHGSLELVQLLVTLGADINSALTVGPFLGYTPLALATYWENTKIVELFVTLGADYNYTLDAGHFKGYNSVTIASIKGWSEITKIFSDSQVKATDEYDQIVKFLKSRGIDHKEFTADHSSKKINLQHSIAAGAYKGYTLIALASQYGSLELVQILVALGADINSALTDGPFTGYTPLALATYWENTKIVELFVTLGADYNYTLDAGHFKGYNSVTIASIKRWSEITKIFSDSQVKATDEYDQIVKFLKSRGIDHKEFTADHSSKKINLQHSITAGPYKGYTLIALASQHGSLELVQLLVTLGADINSALTDGPFTGYTPLALATYGENTKIVELFVTLGADYNYTIDAGPYKGSNAVAIAMMQGLSEITKIFSGAQEATDDSISLSQNITLNNLKAIIPWMKKYEQHRYNIENIEKIKQNVLPKELNNNHLTQAINWEGICSGLSTYLAHSVLTEEEMRYKIKNGENLNPNPYVVKDFFSKIKKINSMDTQNLPSFEDKQAQNFYEEMNIMLYALYQLHDLHQPYIVSKDLTYGKMVDYLNEASESQQAKLLNTYFFTSPKKIISWAQTAKTGVLSISTGAHSMLLYIREQDNVMKIGFYDPNNDSTTIVLQENASSLNDVLNRIFSTKGYQLGSHGTVVICDHIINACDVGKKILIDDDILTSAQVYEAFFCAVSEGNIEGVERTIKMGVNIKNRHYLHGDALKRATFCHYEAIIKLLTDAGASNDGFESLVHVAAKTGDISRLLRNLNASNINAKDAAGMTPLHFAAFKGNIEATKKLIEGGADINIQDYKRWTPLCTAAQEGCKEIVSILLNQGADINVRNNVEATPLYTAAQNGRNEVVKMLLNQGADINLSSNEGITPLAIALLKHNIDIGRLLLQNGADHAIKNYYGCNALDSAVATGNIWSVKLLLEYRADINSVVEGKTLLERAKTHGFAEIFDLLANYKVELEGKNSVSTSLDMPIKDEDKSKNDSFKDEEHNISNNNMTSSETTNIIDEHSSSVEASPLALGGEHFVYQDLM